jgi:phenylalanine-4-hydroxylase
MIREKCKPYSRLDDKDFERILELLILVPLTYIADPDRFFSLMRKFSVILKPMYDAYFDAFGIVALHTLAIQELLYPSEIICILAESKPTSAVYQGVKKL